MGRHSAGRRPARDHLAGTRHRRAVRRTSHPQPLTTDPTDPRPLDGGGAPATAGQALVPAVADGHIRPVLDTSWFFGTADQVVERLRSHRSEGKIVLTVP
ncbi:zinc-binding dehydrogenase [Streptomyces sp. MUSC 125]|uniref:zinc-binding dehydrogenase n=1 Tax=Streptomyces sp. MUSC 125 TaxID=1428624 RepID=UPI000D1452D7|nr:zinc-binding dehydrogenase [Streptomyces sp. MUSC 125]